MSLTRGASVGRRALRGGAGALGLAGILLTAIAASPSGLAAITLAPEHTFPGSDNRSCDIALHPKTGLPHVVWETNDGHLKHSHHDGSRWSAPVPIPGVANVGAEGSRLRQGAVTIAFDPRGRLHVVFVTEGAQRAIGHTWQAKTSGEWAEPVVVHDAGRGKPCWLQMAANRRGWLFLSFEQDLRAYGCAFDGTGWGKPEPLLRLTSHVHHIAVRPNGVPCVLFKAKQRGGYEAWLAVWTTGGWKATQVTDDGGGVDCPSGAVDASGRLHVIWSKCAEEGHDATLKYGRYTGSLMRGEAVGQTNAHNFCRLLIDDGGALYAFLPRRYPPKVLVRERGGGPWSDPIPLGGPRQGYGFFEAAARGNAVHCVYSSSYGPDRPKPVTYRKITRTAEPPRQD